MLIWRKLRANPVLCEPGKKLSRLEARLHLTNVLAAGINGEAAGLKRGEFIASIRFLAKTFKADPLLCPCGGRMRIVSLITEPRVVDRILRHSQSGRCKTRDLFETRTPPGTSANIPQ
jgi:hypothetical protein